MAYLFGQRGLSWNQTGTATTSGPTSDIQFANTFVGGEAVVISGGSIPSGLSAGTYYVSTNSLSGTSFRVASGSPTNGTTAYNNALAGTGTVGSIATGSFTVTVSTTQILPSNGGMGLQSQGYTAISNSVVNSIYFQVGASWSGTNIQAALYQGQGTSATLVSYSAPQSVTGGALNNFSLTTPANVVGGTTYSFLIIPDSSHFLWAVAQNNGYQYLGAYYTNAICQTGGVPNSPIGGPSSGQRPEFIVYADGTTGATYVPQYRRRRIFIPVFYPR
jgi:hypothetical protein